MKKFKSVKHRIWGTIAFSASGMFLICSMNFMGCLEERILSPVEIQQVAHKEEIQRKARTAKHIAPRDALADSSMLDLSPYYDDVVPRYSDSRLLIQHPGTHIWNGIKFDVRGTISGFVMETNTVAVGKKCSEVYFLHAARDGCLQDLENQFFIHFQNGRTETIPIIYGNDVSSDIFADGAVSTNAVVWEEMVRKYGEPQFAGFFIKKWKNPFPNEPITSIGFASESGFLVAITIKETANSIP